MSMELQIASVEERLDQVTSELSQTRDENTKLAEELDRRKNQSKVCNKVIVFFLFFFCLGIYLCAHFHVCMGWVSSNLGLPLVYLRGDKSSMFYSVG